VQQTQIDPRDRPCHTSPAGVSSPPLPGAPDPFGRNSPCTTPSLPRYHPDAPTPTPPSVRLPRTMLCYGTSRVRVLECPPFGQTFPNKVGPCQRNVDEDLHAATPAPRGRRPQPFLERKGCWSPGRESHEALRSGIRRPTCCWSHSEHVPRSSLLPPPPVPVRSSNEAWTSWWRFSSVQTVRASSGVSRWTISLVATTTTDGTPAVARGMTALR
jgi:hypothetical protein